MPGSWFSSTCVTSPQSPRRNCSCPTTCVSTGEVLKGRGCLVPVTTTWLRSYTAARESGGRGLVVGPSGVLAPRLDARSRADKVSRKVCLYMVFSLKKNGKRGVLQCSLKKDAVFRCRGTTADCILLSVGHAIACFAHSGRSSCAQVLPYAGGSVQHSIFYEGGRALHLQEVRFASLFPFWQESFAKSNRPQTQGLRQQPLPFVPERCPQTRHCRPTSRPTMPPAWSASAEDTEEKELWNQVET